MNLFRALKTLMRRFLQLLGFRLIKIKKGAFVALHHDLTIFPSDISEDEKFVDLCERSKLFTMVSIERMYSLYQAVQYVIKNNIPGDIVECGVWRGGSCMLIANTLREMNHEEKKIYLYDTYAGMSKPDERDVRHDGLMAKDTWKSNEKEHYNSWAFSPIDEVKKNMSSTGYPEDKLVFVKGDVKETIPKVIPQKISILRLDTDWYDSTYHELRFLFPALSPGGIIIIDDYGCWKGARKAVDEYFGEQSIKILLHRVDAAGRIGIK